MRRKIITVFVAFLALAVLTIGSGPSAAAAPQQVTCCTSTTPTPTSRPGGRRRRPRRTLGGLPKAAAIVADERTADPGALFVHSGDFMTGDCSSTSTGV